VVARAPEFQPAVLRSSITPYRGLTPYARVGNWAAVIFCILLLAGCGAWRRHELLRAARV
jgi:apolipoprotein N-acyltransferase